MNLPIRGISNKIHSRLFALLALTVSAQAGVIYDFTLSGSSPFQPTTFQVVEADYLGGGGVYSITPFTISDGSTIFTFTQVYATDFGGNYCFVFGANATSFGGCGANLSAGPAPVAMIIAEFPGSTPTAPGSGTTDALINAAPPFAIQFEQAIAPIQFTVTEVPEPTVAPLGVFLLGACLLGARFSRCVDSSKLNLR